MKINLFKQYLPRKLFGRTILIFLLPIVLIETVVFIAFIQRHFEQVTSQMSDAFAYQVKYIIKNAVEETREPKYLSFYNMGKDFGLDVKTIQHEPTLRIKSLDIFDFSGRAFVNTMTKNFDNNIFFDFSKSRQITLIVSLDDRYLSINVPRGRISAANPHQLLVLMVFVSIFLVLLAIIVFRNQLKPLIKLAEVSEAFGKGQSLQFKPSGSDEVRRAGLAFIAMRSRIERQIEQRTQMLSGVSHDLRTPLTRLKLSLALLKNTNETKEMLADVNSMQSMLDEFLAFTKTESSEEVSLIDPVKFIKRIVKRNQRIFEKIELIIQNNQLKFEKLPLRKNIFERAIQNIIDNAINFGSRIVVKVERNKKYLLIKLEDNGPGIEPSDRATALKPFTRLDQSRNQNNHSGVGLGLSIALDTVRSHGGNLSLTKSNELGGLQVRIVIPM
ncbi:MAG: HAMP domain-containing sensor histidine kinase [Paracoccaceae bacterium]|nr:HAMP domain-containing sensor histidine kinase [Paracoccaceae bacterium]